MSACQEGWVDDALPTGCTASQWPRKLVFGCRKRQQAASEEQNMGKTTRLITQSHSSLEPRLSVPDFVSQLWRKIETKSRMESLGSRLGETWQTHYQLLDT